MRPLALLVLLTACGAAPVSEETGALVPEPCGELTGAPELVTLYGQAELAWTVVGVAPNVCVERIEWIPPEYLAEVCDATHLDGFHIDGCAVPQARAVYLREGAFEGRPARLRATVMHEMGHLMRGADGMHLDCDVPGDAIMCPAGGPDGQEPVERDVDFVLAR